MTLCPVSPLGRRGRRQPEPRRLVAGLSAAGGWLLLATSGLAAVGVDFDSFDVRTWDRAEGLPAAPIRAVASTPGGYLWIGTAAGLARFDGVRFVTFATNTTPALGADRISCLLAESGGDLWIGSEVGTLARWHEGTFAAQDLDPRLRGARLNSLAKDRDGVLWIATRGFGLVRYRDGQCEFLSPGTSDEANVLQVVADSDGVMWAIAGQTLLSLEQGRWQAAPRVNMPEVAVRAIAPAREGGLWVGTWHPQSLRARGTDVYQLKDRNWRAGLAPYPWPQDVQRTALGQLVEDDTGRLWAGLLGGGLFYHAPGTGWRRVAPKGQLRSLNTGGLALDQEGELWIGSPAGELHRVRRHSVSTLRLPPAAEDRTVLSSCLARDGSLWVCTDGAGAYRYRQGAFTQFAAPEGLGNGHALVVFEDRQTNLWVGTQVGLYRWNNDRFEAVPGPVCLREVVRTLCEDRQGNLWVGTFGGVVRLGRDGTKVFGPEQGVDHNFVRAIEEDREGRIWLAITDRGLYLLEGDSFHRYGEGQWQGEWSIRALQADSDGALWIAHEGAGLVQLKDGRFIQWTTADGLPSAVLVSVVDDSAGYLWFSSNRGVFGCPKRQFEEYRRGESPPMLFSQLSVADGLESMICSGSGQPVITRDGSRLWVPNGNGLATFDPAEVRRPPVVRPATVEEVLVDTVPRATGADGVLRVPPGTRRVQFGYTSPNLSAAERLRYRFRLVGYDTAWVEAGSRRTAYYTLLPPGQYEFQVAVGQPDGSWRVGPKPLAVVVMPQFWERWWFKAAAGLALAGLLGMAVWTVARTRTRRALALLERQRAFDEQRRRIAQDLHDDLGSSLTEILLLSEAIAREADPSSEVIDRHQTMTRKIQQVVQAMDQVVWTVNPENDSLPRLADYLSDCAQEFLRRSPVHCRLDVMARLPEVPLSASVRHDLFLAVKEALHNVVKHSGANEAWLRISCQAGELHLAVEDNGQGFDLAARNDAGDGLRNLRWRLEHHGGTTEISSRPGQGTTVRFRLPLADHPIPAPPA